MSIDAMAFVKGLTVGGPAPKALMLCIADYTDQWGWAYEQQAVLAAQVEVNERSIRRYAADLAKRGILEVYQLRNRLGNRCNVYRIGGFEPPSARHPIPESHISRHPGLERVRFDGGDGEIPGNPPDNLSYGSIGQIRQPIGHPVQTHRTPGANPPDTAVSGELSSTDINIFARAREAPPAAPEGGGASLASADAAIGAAAQLWQAARADLHREFGDATFRAWIKPLVLVATHPKFVIEAPSRFHRDRALSLYGDRLRAALWRRFESDAEIEWIVELARAPP
jgi:hypothetical protein